MGHCVKKLHQIRSIFTCHFPGNQVQLLDGVLLGAVFDGELCGLVSGKRLFYLSPTACRQESFICQPLSVRVKQLSLKLYMSESAEHSIYIGKGSVMMTKSFFF